MLFFYMDAQEVVTPLKSNRSVSVAILLVAAFFLASCSTSSSSNVTRDGVEVDEVMRVASLDDGEKGVQIEVTRTGEVYLFRGLANVFSTGINVLAERLQRNGIDASAHNYEEWRSVADRIIARKAARKLSPPIALVGHSLGANSVLDMATYLGSNGVEVAYVVSFDPTKPGQMGENIDEVVNYYLTFSDHEKIAVAKPGFTGKLQNIDLSARPGIKHVNIEKQPDLHQVIVKKMLEITKERRYDTRIADHHQP